MLVSQTIVLYSDNFLLLRVMSVSCRPTNIKGIKHPPQKKCYFRCSAASWGLQVISQHALSRCWPYIIDSSNENARSHAAEFGNIATFAALRYSAYAHELEWFFQKRSAPKEDCPTSSLISSTSLAAIMMYAGSWHLMMLRSTSSIIKGWTLVLRSSTCAVVKKVAVYYKRGVECSR